MRILLVQLPAIQLERIRTGSICLYADAGRTKPRKLLTVYDRLLHAPGGVRMVPPPGVCADYGYLLLMNGKTDEGKALLEQETVLYPESKKFIDRILKRFE